MRLLIVIVNYRTADLTIDCLRSLAPEVAAMPGTHVTITDNLSGDDSVAKLSDAIVTNGWSTWANVLPLPKNGGFAYGNNEGIRATLGSEDRGSVNRGSQKPIATLRDPRSSILDPRSSAPDYVLLLNPDTIVRPGAMTALVEFMDANPKVGIAGSRLEHPDGEGQRSAFRFHTVLSELEHGLRFGPVSKLLKNHIVAPEIPTTACQTDWVAGASMIIRRSVIDAIGLMDERYFMYFEEVDFCLRANRAGWPCWYVPQSRVVHLVGQASGVTDASRAKRRRPAYWFDSRRWYFVKNHGRFKTFLADSAWAMGFGVFRVRQFLQRKSSNDPKLMLWDFIRYNFLLVGRK